MIMIARVWKNKQKMRKRSNKNIRIARNKRRL
jgi:hypothetical protein